MQTKLGAVVSALLKIAESVRSKGISLNGNAVGAYVGGTQYQKGDIVSYTDGASYIAKTATLGNVPTNTTYWVKLADKGANGTNGTNGTNGQGVPTGGTAGQVLKKNSATNYDTVWGSVAGGGDVLGPATNTDLYIPQWNGANSKTLKDGVPIPAGGLAGLTALGDKVDKITGKGLSTEDYSTAEKSKLAGIASGAEVNVNADWNAGSGDAQILNKPTIPSALSALSDDATHRLVTDTDKSNWNGKQSALGFTPENSANKGANNGYAGLDASGKVPVSQLPAPRTNTITSSATPSINTDTTDIFTITALAVAITSMTTNLSGSPVNGQKLIIRILDNGTARAITWGASFVSRGATLPTTTVISKYLYVGFIYNSTAAKWDCVAVANEA